MTVVQTYPTIQEGIVNQIKSFGIGPISPNTIVLGLSHFESETVNYVEILDTAKIDKKNVLIFSSGGKEISDNIFAKRLRKMQKEIDIWWDGTYRNNFELMLSYTTTLTDGIIWGNTDVTLKSVVSDEGAKENLEAYFRGYLTESRLKFGLEVYVEPGSQDFLPYISKHSYDSHLTFVGLPQSETKKRPSVISLKSRNSSKQWVLSLSSPVLTTSTTKKSTIKGRNSRSAQRFFQGTQFNECLLKLLVFKLKIDFNVCVCYYHLMIN